MTIEQWILVLGISSILLLIYIGIRILLKLNDLEEMIS